MNALFFVLAAVVYLAMGADTPIYEDFVSPAFAICAALGIVAMVYALIAFQTRNWQFPALLLIVGYLGFANHNAYKTRFENMNYDAAKLVPLRERVDAEYISGVATPKPSASPPFLASDETARNNWLAKRKKDSDAVGGKPKLVVVAVSGGATRSAYWTATVLDRVEREIKKDGGDFGSKVRIITGAFGRNARHGILRRPSPRRRQNDCRTDFLGRDGADQQHETLGQIHRVSGDLAIALSHAARLGPRRRTRARLVQAAIPDLQPAQLGRER